VPSVIDLSVGKKSTYFRISVPNNFQTGQYRIVWETNGERSPPIYTPIKSSIVNVIE